MTADRPRRRAAGRRPGLPRSATGRGADGDRRRARSRARSSSCRPGRRCPSSGSAPRSRRWAGAWPSRCADRPAPSDASPAPPRVIVAPVRALLQRLGPLERDGAASWSGRGEQVDVDALLRRAGGAGLPARAPGRAPRRVRGARRHRRRVPLDGGRAGAHRPVGRRGRPPDRVRRQRPALVARPRRGRALRLPRARCSPTRCGRAAAALVARRPWGRRQWERLAAGRALRRHGVVAARSSTPRSGSCPTCCRPGAPGRPGRAPPDPGPGRRSCSTRRRRWPRPWPPPGAPSDGRRGRAFPAPPRRPSSACSRDSPAGVLAAAAGPRGSRRPPR